jgi:hypothetical protein
MYVLIRSLPDGTIRAHSTTFPTVNAAARASGYALYDNTRVSRADAQRFSRHLSGVSPNAIVGHESGYRFRILAADRTSNGVVITPGLRVLDYDRHTGTVDPAQFMDEGPLMPGGEHFDHCYYVLRDGEDRPHARFNGDRLSTRL